MEINITIKIGEIENTRRFRLEENDAYNIDWTEAVQECINDLKEVINDN